MSNDAQSDKPREPLHLRLSDAANHLLRFVYRKGIGDFNDRLHNLLLEASAAARSSCAPMIHAAWRYRNKKTGKETLTHQPPDRVLFPDDFEIVELFAKDPMLARPECADTINAAGQENKAGAARESAVFLAPSQPSRSLPNNPAPAAPAEGSTPRTDAVLEATEALGPGSIVVIPPGHPPCDPWALARQLEREADHWQAKCHKAWEDGDRLTQRAMQAEARSASATLVAALERLGSMEAFVILRAVNAEADAELLARIDYARAALSATTPAQEKP